MKDKSIETEKMRDNRTRKIMIRYGIATFLLLGSSVIWYNNLHDDNESAGSSSPLVTVSASPNSSVEVSLPPNSAIFDFGDNAYYALLLKESDRLFTQAVKTSEGILWSPAPARIENGNMDDHVTEIERWYIFTPLRMVRVVNL